MMTAKSEKLTIENLLDRLNEWRFYPKFQLERHFDILLSFVLPEILYQVAKDNKIELFGRLSEQPEILFSSTIIPEFPLPLNLFDSNKQGHLANAVDFAVFIPKIDQNSVNMVLFIELKTDEASARDSQTRCMHSIHVDDTPFSDYLKAIIITVLNSKHNARKYLFLLQKLLKLGLLQGLEKMFSEFDKKHKFYKAKYLSPGNISSNADSVEYCSLVIAPELTVKKIRHDLDLKELPTLSFKEAKEMLKKASAASSKDESFNRIAEYLGEWDQSPIQKMKDFLHSH